MQRPPCRSRWNRELGSTCRKILLTPLAERTPNKFAPRTEFLHMFAVQILGSFIQNRVLEEAAIHFGHFDVGSNIWNKVMTTI